jgi:hypothetical protein
MTPPAASGTLPRTVAPRAPRRVSGPAARKRAHPPQDARRRAAAPDPFVLRALHRTRALSDSRFLDRLIRGRLWIPLVAAGLMGIVFMQVSMLKLNAGIGRAVQSAQTLERQNSMMRADVSRMESGSKIDAVAKSLGMVAPAATTSPSYVTTKASGLAAAAARRMTAADPDAILRAKQATALAAGQSVAGLTTTAGTGTIGAAATTGTATTGTATTATGAVGTATTAATTQAPGTGATGATTPSTGAGTAAPPQQSAASGTGTAAGTGTTGGGTAGATGAGTGAASGTGTAGAGTAGATGAATARAGTAATGPATTTSGGAVAPAAG